ncbi:MAG TPA: FAD binding domain-containing protein [Stellaceae bacterium]|nr:FAD binding domain-containing protein [Stellaceae bacterium]
MKAAGFDYARAGSVEEACRLLDGAGGDGKIIAGGQTLVPLLVMRLARPTLVIDITHIAALLGVAGDDNGVVIKAATRQADVLSDEIVHRRLPLLAKALRLVGHPQTRNRGTVGGSLANADPAAEICLVARTLDAELTAHATSGARKIAMADFCAGAMTTSLGAKECLTEIRFPAWHEAGRVGTGFAEMSVRQSDFALVAASCQLALDRDGVCRRIALALGGVEPTPLRAAPAETHLTGTRLDAGDVAVAMSEMQQALSPLADIHASADYRRRVAGALAAQAIAAARDEALAVRV